MRDPNWFQKKWGRLDEVPMDDVYKRLSDLEIKIKQLEEKFSEVIEDIKILKEENTSTTNEIYRLENSLDARIDILAEHCRINYDV
jgi:peptidoglycan hydrolase CwlO-like protein